MSCIFEAQMQRILHLLYKWSGNSPGALGPPAVSLLSLHFQGRWTHTGEAKLHKSGSPASENVGISWSADCNFLKNKVCEEKTLV